MRMKGRNKRKCRLEVHFLYYYQRWKSLFFKHEHKSWTNDKRDKIPFIIKGNFWRQSKVRESFHFLISLSSLSDLSWIAFVFSVEGKERRRKKNSIVLLLGLSFVGVVQLSQVTLYFIWITHKSLLVVFMMSLFLFLPSSSFLEYKVNEFFNWKRERESSKETS